MSNFLLKLISVEDIEPISKLTQQLNPEKTQDVLQAMHKEMFMFNNYKCFGLFQDETLLGISSGWITVKLYSGKQLELDNVIIDSKHQSKGLGGIFIQLIEEWAKAEDCVTMELNTYVTNSRSHKFYFNQGFKIIGYHFQKKI